MRRLHWLAVAVAALVTTSVAVGAVPNKVTVTGKVQAVSPASITVAGTFCVFVPTNSRMMMPAIIRDVAVGDTAQLSCVRSNGRLVVASIVERPAGAVVVRGPVTNATETSITIRGVTCTFSVTGSTNPRIMVATRISGLSLMACLRANGHNTLSAATELTPRAGHLVLISGTVSAVSPSSITVSGVTCLVSHRKPLPGFPTIIRGVNPGDAVVMACITVGGHLVATGVNGG